MPWCQRNRDDSAAQNATEDTPRALISKLTTAHTQVSSEGKGETGKKLELNLEAGIAPNLWGGGKGRAVNF